MFPRNVKNVRLAWDSNRNIFTHQSHKSTCAFFRSVQTRYFLHAVVPPGGKTYQAGFPIFSNTVVRLRDLEVCFVASSKLIGVGFIYTCLLTFDL